jgi:hypothetical protein
MGIVYYFVFYAK